ncbi:unnamed protein product [Mytilus coruscus]|uniref:PLAT domain-containing protein n=1 Tax=Mytilus coruscus TaxID=42192 RepID=A0A6J8DU44_MYTCO|nr:unnamed protein product [Mytilus coruscus]
MANESGTCIQYEVHIWTSDIHGAGTDSDVFIQLIGTDAETEKIELRDSSNNFEQAREDEFLLEAADLGDIRKIKIGHDGSSFMSGWHLNKVLIKRRPKAGTKKPQRQTTPNYSTGLYDGIETDDYWFIVDRWFDTSEDDNKIERELFPTDKKGNPLFVTEETTRNISTPSTKDEATTVQRSSNIESQKSPQYESTERTNNRDDPFYVPSAYDKDPKAELETIKQYRKIHKNTILPSKTPSRKGATESSLTNKVYSPIQEENTQAILDIHTEDNQYYTNDFQHNPSPEISLSYHDPESVL